MLQSYLPVIVFVGLGVIVGGAFTALNHVLGPKRPSRVKSEPYECGLPTEVTRTFRFGISFYMVAMLFILFDIEVVFLWSWLTVFKNPGMGSPEADLAFQWFSFAAVMIYMVLWIIGDAYVLRVNAIDWDEAPEIHEAKFGSPQREAAPSTMPDAALQPAGGGK